MTYTEAKKRVFATGTVPDGYFGDRKKVGFALHPNGHIMVVADCGYYTYQTPQVTNEPEAMWTLKHHPSSNAKNVWVTRDLNY